MSGTQDRYQHVFCRKTQGVHYTPAKLSQFVSENIIHKMTNKVQMVIADPAIGDGELILSFLSLLEFTDNIEVIGFDINLVSLERSKSRILQRYPNIKLKLIHDDFLNYCLTIKLDNENYILPKFDVIIANPPYVRAQNLGTSQSQYLSKHFGLKGCIDVYQAFVIGMSLCLSKTGIAGVIVSNRFLSIKGASNFRQSVYDLYDIHHIWDFGDTKLFDAAVLPAVLLLSLKNTFPQISTQFRSIYETQEIAEQVADSPIEAIALSGVTLCANGKSYLTKAGFLDFMPAATDVWQLKDANSENWLAKVNKKAWAKFGDIGKIRVGVKTTADSIFIKKSWTEETGFTPELIKPLITHHVAARFKQSSKETKYILYTHEMRDGKKKAVDLNHYPISKAYLEKHKDKLAGRSYINKSKRNWFEIWVPQQPELWLEEKIVFRDICEQPTFWLDDKQSIVNGDCYWMLNDFKKEQKDILWLVLAVANSTFIELFYDIKFNNKLYSNKRRFISQYVEQFPLPDPSTNIAKKMIKFAKEIFTCTNIEQRKESENLLNDLVWQAFGFPLADSL